MIVARIRLAVFDMAGTTVDDVIDGVPLVLRNYDDAFRRHGVEVPMETLNDMRGRDKREVINMLGGDKAPAIYRDFVEMLQANIGKVEEMKAPRRHSPGLGSTVSPSVSRAASRRLSHMTSSNTFDGRNRGSSTIGPAAR